MPHIGAGEHVRRYGEVAVGSDHMAFDGGDVSWGKTIRVIVRGVVDMVDMVDIVDAVSDAATAREAEKNQHMLPPRQEL